MSQHIDAVAKQSGLDTLNNKIKPSLLDVTDKAYTSGSIDDIPCGIYRVYANVTGTPIYGPGYCSTYERESGTKLQIFVEDSNRMFTRTKANGTWTSWQELALNSNFGMYILGANQDLLDIARDTTICPENTIRWINCRNGVISNLTDGNYGVACVTKRVSSAISITLYKDDGTMYRTYWNNTSQKWISWEQLALNSNINKQIVVENVGGDNSETIPANGVKNIVMNVAKTGYTPIGIVGITGSGTTGIVLQEYYTSQNIVSLYLRNVLSSDITPSKLYVRVLYSRN